MVVGIRRSVWQKIKTDPGCKFTVAVSDWDGICLRTWPHRYVDRASGATSHAGYPMRAFPCEIAQFSSRLAPKFQVLETICASERPSHILVLLEGMCTAPCFRLSPSMPINARRRMGPVTRVECDLLRRCHSRTGPRVLKDRLACNTENKHPPGPSQNSGNNIRISKRRAGEVVHAANLRAHGHQFRGTHCD